MKNEMALRLKKCMELRNKKATDVAYACGFSRGMMSNYLSGKRRPKTDRVFDIANYLDVNPLYILCFSDQIIAPVSQPLNTLSGDKSEKEIVIEEISANCTFLDLNTLKNISAMITTLAKGKRH